MRSFVTKKISSNRTFGGTLSSARTKLDISLAQAESETKIPAKYLQALENDDFSKLPREAYNIGFVRCYATYLHLDPGSLVSLYRDARSQTWHGMNESSVAFSPRRVGDWHFLITPKLLTVIGTIIVFGGIAGYIILELQQFTSPPRLEISSVPAEFTTDRDQVVLAGNVSEGATMTINGEPIFVSQEGGFSQEVQLSPGVNEIEVQARSRADRVSRQVVQVLFSGDLASSSSSVKKK